MELSPLQVARIYNYRARSRALEWQLPSSDSPNGAGWTEHSGAGSAQSTGFCNISLEGDTSGDGDFTAEKTQLSSVIRGGFTPRAPEQRGAVRTPRVFYPGVPPQVGRLQPGNDPEVFFGTRTLAQGLCLSLPQGLQFPENCPALPPTLSSASAPTKCTHLILGGQCHAEDAL